MTVRSLPTKPKQPKGGPRRVRVTEGVLVLPPCALSDLPPSATLGHFLGVLALRFDTAEGPAAIFLHDLNRSDIDALLLAQKEQAEAQPGTGYARRALWWEARP